jgi:regulator of protease activity HflC (stomatin/prohibitin superfamily)
MKSIVAKSFIIFQIIEPVNYLVNIRDPDRAVEVLCQAILRDVVGYNTYDALLSNKRELAFEMEVCNI